jgi:hypothetical protein
MPHPPAGAGKSSFDLIDGAALFRLLALNPTLYLAQFHLTAPTMKRSAT